MTKKNTSNTPPEEKNITETLSSSVMVIMTLIFVFLYAAAFWGKLDPLKDNIMMTRFEPLLLLFIGYYFGRLPARQSEKTLKEEIMRQTQKAAAAQYAKEKALQDRETLEEKTKNARTALRMIPLTEQKESGVAQSEAFKTALGILDS